jgi:DNA replication and repair protein RecF
LPGIPDSDYRICYNQMVMHVTHLSLTNFRNYGRLELPLPAGPILLHGNNAQGKTNLLEALYYLATTRSPHAAQDEELINWSAGQSQEPVIVGRLVAQVVTAQGERQLEMRLIKEQQSGYNGQSSFRREALVNRRKVRLMDLLGNLRVVLFLPEDMELITGSPATRRRYVDITLCQIDPIYCQTLSQYNKVLEQRNALLRRLAEGNGSRDVLPVFSEKLVHLGSQIFARRTRFFTELAREAQRIHYEALTGGHESIRLHYLPRLRGHLSNRQGDTGALVQLYQWLQNHQDDAARIAADYEQALTEAEPAELARGSTSVGPHRDDWLIEVNGRSLSSYGSRGQQRSALLALKMAEIQWMAARTDETPLLLLDEVVAELDGRRRELLLHYVQQATQSLLTATDPGMFTASFLEQATRLQVENGRVQSA